jgi:hypothetical protein
MKKAPKAEKPVDVTNKVNACPRAPLPILRRELIFAVATPANQNTVSGVFPVNCSR